MNRRDFVCLVCAATVWPFNARAQPLGPPVIGFFNVASPKGFANYVAAFHRGLNEAGYVEAQNVAIEYRWAEDHYDRLPEIAAHLLPGQIRRLASTPPANKDAKKGSS